MVPVRRPIQMLLFNFQLKINANMHCVSVCGGARVPALALPSIDLVETVSRLAIENGANQICVLLI